MQVLTDLFLYDYLYIPCLEHISVVFFFSFMPMTFEIVSTHVPINSTNACEVLSE